MNTDLEDSSELPVPIAAVERDTGLSKDTLRIWERRYGFPRPQRDGQGERLYDRAQVDQLRLLKRLMDAGHRPGRIVALPMQDLQALATSAASAASAAEAGDIADAMALVRRHDVRSLRHLLQRLLARQGVAQFLTEVISPLNTVVGEAWMRGRLEVFEEHLYTEVVQSVLRGAIAALPETPRGGSGVRVLLATLPGEPHGLGILMAEAMLALEGAETLSLGTQTPLADIVRAAQAFDARLVALGFTPCTPPHQIVASLAELRARLPAAVALWAGGSAPVLRRRALSGVTAVTTLTAIACELRRLEPPAGVAPEPVAH